jgi:single-strand DNA-binding protein
VSYQVLVLVGNLGGDPVLRYSPDGKAFCTFSVAVNEKYKNSAGDAVENVTWFRVTVWGKQAETANQYLSKGRQVLVEGTIRSGPDGNPRIWEGSDGTPHASHEVRADKVRFLASGGGSKEVPAEPDEAAPEIE